MAGSRELYDLETKYSDIEKRAIAYLATRRFAITSDCHHDLHDYLCELASDDIEDSRTLSIVTWGVLEAIMKGIALEVGTGSERAWYLKPHDELDLFPEQIIKITKLYSEV